MIPNPNISAQSSFGGTQSSPEKKEYMTVASLTKTGERSTHASSSIKN
jgi:hypothetical protein